MNRLSQRSFHCPPAMEAARNDGSGYSRSFNPLGDAHGLPTKGQYSVVPAISRLFFRGGPFAVARRIAKSVVDAFEAVLHGRTQPHISKKRFKRVPPLWANRNASATVASVGLVCGTVAAVAHSLPRRILGRLLHSVRSAPGNEDASAVTTATACGAVAKMATADNVASSAFAEAFPGDQSALSAARFPNDCQSPEYLPSHILETWVSFDRIVRSHLNLLVRFTVVRTAMQHELRGCSHYSLTATERQ